MKRFGERVMLLLVLCVFALSGCSLYGGPGDETGNGETDLSKIECGKFGKGACIMTAGLLCERDVWVDFDTDANLIIYNTMSQSLCTSPRGNGVWYSASQLQGK
jgi:hypothetical protein